jgi:hypothetical protein
LAECESGEPRHGLNGSERPLGRAGKNTSRDSNQKDHPKDTSYPDNTKTKRLFGTVLNGPKLEKSVNLLLLNAHLNLKILNLRFQLYPLL